MRTRWMAPLIAAFWGCEPQVTNVAAPPDCPRQEPIAGEPCDGHDTCGYAGEPCGRSYACADGVWQSASGSCGPPPPPGPCPTSIPTISAPCKSSGQACSFTVDGTCPGLFVATCGANGWEVSNQSPPCMPPPCPMDEPTAGSPCSFPQQSCTYVVTPPGCPPETQDATCEGGAWTIQTNGTCTP